MCVLGAVVFPLSVFAKKLNLNFYYDDHQYKVISMERAHAGSVLFYEDGKLLGKYENLVVNESSLTSALVTVAGDGVALEIDSEGSRNKFHVIAPISLIGGKPHIDCVYKTVYDAVDEIRSVGESCQKIELEKFDVHSAINDDGLIAYTDKYNWLKSIPRNVCANPVGLEVSPYRVARCSEGGVSDAKNEKIMVFTNQDKLLFSIVGYELIPKISGAKYMLTSDLDNIIIMLNGNLACHSKKFSASTRLVGTAKIKNKFTVNYTIDSIGNCLTGNYSYVGKKENIEIIGYRHGDLYNFLEIGKNRISSGLFVLNRIEPRARGVWISVPPANPLSVN
jgi:hypothetical protein